MSTTIDWLISIEKFIAAEDYISIRAAAREIFELEPNSPDGPLALAEAETYLSNFDSAEFYLEQAASFPISPHTISSVRAGFVKANIFAKKFMPYSAARAFEDFIRKENIMADKKKLLSKLKEPTKEERIYFAILERLFCLAVSNYALLGDAKKCRDTLFLAAELSVSNSLTLYSNFLFFSNYRPLTSSEAKRALSFYADLSKKNSPGEVLYRKDVSGEHTKIRVGYISGVFHEHATLSFLPGLLSTPNTDEFEVYVYNLGREDAYSRKLREFRVHWRNLAALSPRDAALKIAGDYIDILVDLAGHAEGSALNVLAYRPAAVLISTLGYFASTGAPFVDFFMADKFIMPLGKSERFSEQCVNLHKHSVLCYTPPELWESEQPKVETKKVIIPFQSNGYPTFLCSQNLLKLSDDLLLLWRKVFDEIEDFKLILQNKVCSTKEGREFLQRRLKNLGYKLSQTELLPFAPDYKHTFENADIVLDTTPYPGGATTCEALYAGTPVITLKGNDPWSRLGASILTAAHMEDLIAETPKNYAQIMLTLASNPSKILKYKEKLKENLKNSRLMDIKGYSKEVFEIYKKIYDDNIR